MTDLELVGMYRKWSREEQSNRWLPPYPDSIREFKKWLVLVEGIDFSEQEQQFLENFKNFQEEDE